MTELVGSPMSAPGQLTVLSERHFEAPAPSNLQVVDPENAYSATKEEEWVTRKKTELTTTRQVETRVKRQLILEDGKVVGDSGPVVTSSTSEDQEKQETSVTEHRTAGGDDAPAVEWTATPGTVREVKEKTVTSREEREEVVETEAVQHLGDLTEDAYQASVRDQTDVRSALLTGVGTVVGDVTPRIVHQSSSSRKVVDTDQKDSRSELQPDGRIVTETRHTAEREEEHGEELPERGDDVEEEETRRESAHRFARTKDQDLVEYIADGVKIGEEMRYSAEQTEGERVGDAPGDWDSLSARIRRMRRQGQAKPPAADRKDALTRRPLDFDQEEETRKAETSKWLEHHFGSDSRSSRGSTEDEEPPRPTNTTSFINVTMKSRSINHPHQKVVTTTPVNGHSPTPKAYVTNGNSSSRVFVSSPESEETSPTAANGYFQGVSDWTERRRTERVQVLPSGSDHTFSPGPMSPGGSSLDRGSPRSPISPSPFRTPVYHTSSNSSFQKLSSERLTASPATLNTSYRDGLLNGHVNGNGPDRATSPYHSKVHVSNGSSYVVNGSVAREDERRQRYPSAEDNRRRYDKDEVDDEPPRPQQNGYRRRELDPSPDYGVEPSTSPSPSPPPPPEPGIKKVYQRTRFAADIPPPPVKQQAPTPPPPTSSSQGRSKSPGQSTASLIGESFRRLVGKFRSASAERKARRRSKRSSRSPSPRSTYQQGHVIDAHIEGPVAPPRQRAQSRRDMDSRRSPAVQRFYLGEDPFGGSIYGREKEYAGVVPAKSSRRHHHRVNGHRGDDEINRVEHVSSSTLGRLGKSSSNHVEHEVPSQRATQTLPRKLHEERRHVYTPRGGAEWGVRRAQQQHGSTINVSIINNVTPPPAKPARTYLSRSKSFNVHALGPVEASRGNVSSINNNNNNNNNHLPLRDSANLYKSNPHLHRLDESPPPLKSPGILASISRSQRDLTDVSSPDRLKETSFGLGRSTDKQNRYSKSTSNLLTSDYSSGGSSSTQEAKKRLFMRGLMDRAPELFRTLHGEEENLHNGSFRSSTPDSDRPSPYRVTRVNNGAGNNKDYSETVRITSKSDDPLRPSVTNTVQSFTKKTVPTPRGLSTETIESKETHTVTKSRFGGTPVNGVKYLDSGSKYSMRNGGSGGVVIEVRPGRK